MVKATSKDKTGVLNGIAISENDPRKRESEKQVNPTKNRFSFFMISME